MSEKSSNCHILLRRPVLDTGLGFFVRRVKNSLAPHQVRGDGLK